MGRQVTVSSSRTVTVRRGGQEVQSGSSYEPGETLAVTVSNSEGYVLLEASGGAQFSGGSCSKRRFEGSSSMVAMPVDGSTVQIWALWATCYCQVKSTSLITLKAQTSSPTATPTTPPSYQPTFLPTLCPTESPTIWPTAIPTTHPTSVPTGSPSLYLTESAVPSVTLQPSSPTSPPSIAPSPSPTDTPTAYPSSTPTNIPSHDPTWGPSGIPSSAPTPLPTSLVHAPAPAQTITPTRLLPVRYTLSAVISARGILLSDLDLYMKQILRIFSDALALEVNRLSVKPIVERAGSSSTIDTSQSRALLESPFESQFLLSAVAYESQFDAEHSAQILSSFLEDSSSSGFRSQLYEMTSLNVTTVALYGVDILQFYEMSRFSYMCQISPKLSLHWSITSGSKSDFIVGMLSYQGMSWFGGGIIHAESTLMVEDPANVVYMCTSVDSCGVYVVTSYGAGGITLDSRYRNGSGISYMHSTSTTQYLHFQRQRETGITTDPVLDLGIGMSNRLIWAHGGEWPTKHSDRGVAAVYWNEGKCKALSEEYPSTWVLIVAGVVILLSLATLLNHCQNIIPGKCKTLLHTQVSDIFPCISFLLADDLGLISLGGLLLSSLFLCLLAWYVRSTVEFYESERGYTKNRAVSISVGHAALFVISLVSLPVTKMPYITVLTGVAYDRITKYHRNLGRLGVSLVVIHFLTLLDVWGYDTLFQSDRIGRAIPVFGWFAGLCFVVMSIFAMHSIRRKWFSLFRWMHLLFIPGVGLLCLHIPQAKWFLLLPVAVYMMDILLKWKALVTQVVVTDVKAVGDSYTILSLRSHEMKSCAPGCFVWLHISQVSATQWHPFSVYNFNELSGEFDVAMKTCPRGWTEKVNFRVRESLPLKVHVFGPYGQLSLDLRSGGYTHVYLISGGIGVTPILSIADYFSRASETKTVDTLLPQFTVMSVAKSESFFEEFADFFLSYRASGMNVLLYCTEGKRPVKVIPTHISKLEQKSETINSTALAKTTISHTNIASTGQTSDDEFGQAIVLGNDNDRSCQPSSNTYHTQTKKPPLKFSPRSSPKPDISSIYRIMKFSRPDVKSDLFKVCSSGRATVAVVVCGPNSLSKSVRDACNLVSRSTKCRIDLHIEAFNI